MKLYDKKHNNNMARLAKHSTSTPFWANWDQSNPYDTI